MHMSDRRKARTIQLGIMCRHAGWQVRRHLLTPDELLRNPREPIPDRT